jgi:hypothetical protein
MKTTFFVILALVATNLFAQTSVIVDMYNYSKFEGSYRPMMVTLGSHKLSDKTTLEWYTHISPDFSAFTIGFGHKLAKNWIGVGMIGVENNPKLAYGKATLLHPTENLFFMVGAEYGVSGWWAMSMAHMPVQKDSPIRVGYFARRFEGVGPYGEVAKGKVHFWIAPILYNPETKGFGTEFGLRLHL